MCQDADPSPSILVKTIGRQLPQFAGPSRELVLRKGKKRAKRENRKNEPGPRRHSVRRLPSAPMNDDLNSLTLSVHQRPVMFAPAVWCNDVRPVACRQHRRNHRPPRRGRSATVNTCAPTSSTTARAPTVPFISHWSPAKLAASASHAEKSEHAATVMWGT